MAKTFDNISEASATNYLFLFAQRTLALRDEPPTPPPLNVLGLPCKVTCLLWEWRHPQKVYPSAPTIEEDAKAEEGAADMLKPADNDIAAETVTVEKKAPYAVDLEKATEKIAPLAEKATEYILDHQDDAAQEDRWRTTMKRDTMKRFREQRETIDEVHKIVKDLKYLASQAK